MIKLRRLGHAALCVKDIDRALGFYVTGIGFEVTDRRRTPEGREQVYLRCGAEHHDLCLIESDQAPGLDHVAYEVGSWWEILRAAEYCREHGIEIIEEPQEKEHEGNCKSLMLQCPGPLRLELYCGMAEYDVPAAVGRTGARLRKLGHVAPVLIDTNPAVAFLQEHWKMRLTGRIQPVDCYFLSVNEVDHDLTLMKQNTVKGYHVPHVSYKLGTMAEMERAYEWAKSANLEILMPPGKRPAGSIRTLDIYDPDGNLFEYYHGMDNVHTGIPVRDFNRINTWGE